MVFNIGNQQGGVVNNVAGDQTYNQQRPISYTAAPQSIRDSFLNLRGELSRAGIPPHVRAAIDEDVQALDRESARPEPDTATLANYATRVTRALSSTGALAAAGSSLVTALGTLASSLGPLGQPILHMIGL